MTASPIPAAGRVLGLDLGRRRIGVAVTDSGQSVATGVATVERGGTGQQDGYSAVASLIVQYGAVGVVVGVPYSLSGSVGPAGAAVLEEVGRLAAYLAVPVETVDERFTTVVAAGALRRAGRTTRRQREVVDREAAAALLQGWAERRRAAG